MRLQVFFSLSLSLTLSLSFLLHRTGFPINPSYSLIPYTPLTNSSTIQKCHSSSHCHPHFQPSPPSVPFCSWAEKQLKQFSCRELLSLIAMKDTFSHHSLGDFFFSLSLFLSVWVEMQALPQSVGSLKGVIITSFSMLAVGKDFTPHNY